MPRTATLTAAPRKALAVAGAAAALTGIGIGTATAANAATLTPAHNSTVTHGARHDAPARHAAKTAKTRRAAPRRPARTTAPRKPYEIYDSVNPAALPARHVAATYANGNYAATPAQIASHKIIWIDTNGTDPRANALDVEPGDATPTTAENWAWHRLHASPHSLAILYTMRSEWQATKNAVRHLPPTMRTHIRWWIADPTGTPHIVPGASATQWYWGHNYDITTANHNL
jgi:hypothetical protein